MSSDPNSAHPAPTSPKLADRDTRGLGEWAAFPVFLEPGDHEVRLHLRDGTPGTLLRLVLEPADNPDAAAPIGTIELEGNAVGRKTWSLPKVHVDVGGRHTLRIEVLGPACEIERAEMLPLHRRPQAPTPVKPAAKTATPFAGTTQPAIAPGQRSNPFDPGDASVTYPTDADPFDTSGQLPSNTPSAAHDDTVGWCVGGEWFEQAVDLPVGAYDICVRAAAPTGDVDIDVLLNGGVLGTMRLESTQHFGDHHPNVLRDIQLDTDTRGILRIEINGAACDVASVHIEPAGSFDAELTATMTEKPGTEQPVGLGASAFDIIPPADTADAEDIDDDPISTLGVVDADFDRIADDFVQHPDDLQVRPEDDVIIDVSTTPGSANDDDSANERDDNEVNRGMAEALLAMADTLLPTDEPPVAEEPKSESPTETPPTDDAALAIDELAETYGLELEEDSANAPEPTEVAQPVEETLAPTGLAQIAEVPEETRTVTVRRRDAGSGWVLGYVRGQDAQWFEGERKPMGHRNGKWSALSASANTNELIAVAWPKVGASPVATWTNTRDTAVSVDIAGELTLDWHKIGNDRLANPALVADVVLAVVDADGAVHPRFARNNLTKPSKTWRRETLHLDLTGQSAELLPGGSILVGLRVTGAEAPEFAVALHDALVLEVTPLSE
ncbi:MAG: hypothetical protein AAGD32_15420 [Planctomycetota bacterium]